MLVAISIPIFTSQLEKSRDATSMSNIRSAYAEAQSAYLTGTTGGNVTAVNLDKGVGTIVVSNVAIKSQVANNWSGLDAELPFTHTSLADTGANKTGALTFTYAVDATTKEVSISDVSFA